LKKFNIKGFIFDLDGTLIDSEPLYLQADKMLLQKYGITFTKEMKEKYIGGGNLEEMKDFKNIYSNVIYETIEELVNRKNEIYLDIISHGIPIYEKMFNMLKYVKSLGLKTALASGTSQNVLENIVSNLNLEKYFDTFLSTELVKVSKPNPLVFLESLKRLGISNYECVVFEDSYHGVVAAKRANIYCVATPYLINRPLEKEFYEVEILFKNGMDEFDYEKVLKHFGLPIK